MILLLDIRGDTLDLKLFVKFSAAALDCTTL